MAWQMPKAAIAKRILIAAGIVCLTWVCLPSRASWSLDQVAEHRNNNLGAAGCLGAPFAIADFDGDRKADLATVQVIRNTAFSSHYAIHFRLTAGPESAIGITAPFGGLLLQPLDVNGDELVDLIVTTALDRQFVAIFLNDGHGNFTQARPGSFVAIENNVGETFAVPGGQSGERGTLIPTRYSSGTAIAWLTGILPQLNTKSFIVGRREIAVADCKYASSGRSPPAPVFPA